VSLRVAADQPEKLWGYLPSAGPKLTNNRRTIVFLVGSPPFTTTDLSFRTKKADPRTSYATVWRLTALAQGNLSCGPDPSLWARQGSVHSVENPH
jgi:Fe2+ or Zn2+ uptake regulation protein